MPEDGRTRQESVSYHNNIVVVEKLKNSVRHGCKIKKI